MASQSPLYEISPDIELLPLVYDDDVLFRADPHITRPKLDTMPPDYTCEWLSTNEKVRMIASFLPRGNFFFPSLLSPSSCAMN